MSLVMLEIIFGHHPLSRQVNTLLAQRLSL
jgi:hypothetical protein